MSFDASVISVTPLKEVAKQRYFFTQDNDSHWYLIPADMREEFGQWLEHQQKLWGESHTDEEFKKLDAEYTGADFNNYRIDDVEGYTFENPQERG